MQCFALIPLSMNPLQWSRNSVAHVRQSRVAFGDFKRGMRTRELDETDFSAGSYGRHGDRDATYWAKGLACES